MADANVIETRALVKQYGDVRVVGGLTLQVRRGEIYGFLGRNGAGKTTTLRMLLGLIRPTSGEVRLLGGPIVGGAPSVFGRVGYLVESASAYPNLTVRENLTIQQRLTRSAHAAVDNALALLDLGPYADRRAGTLSLGNKQRLSLARALLHSPDVVLLDEPTNGLDPAAIVAVRDLLRDCVRARGLTVFMSSHMLSEVAVLADRIGIIHQGRLIEESTIAELRARSRSYLEVRTSDTARAVALLQRQPAAVDLDVHEGAIRVVGGATLAPAIARVLVEAGLDVYSLTPASEDIESYFLRLTDEQS